jgi:hypothetical protein
MHVPLRVLACAIVLFGAVLFVGCVLVPWLGGPSLLPTDLREICQTFIEEHERGVVLEAQDEIVRDDLTVKREIAADVIAGRTSLAEAVMEFRRLRQRKLDVGGPEFPGLAHELEQDGLARQVIAWVMMTLKNDPRRDVVLDRLECELEATEPGLLR